MKIHALILLGIVTISCQCRAQQPQQESSYLILEALQEHIDQGTPILDSLYPLRSLPAHASQWKELTPEDTVFIAGALRQSEGVRLQPSVVKVRMIPAAPILKALETGDAESLKKLQDAQPFYMITAPLYFRGNTRALVGFSRVPGFGVTYLLEKKDNKWSILKEYFGYMN